MKRAILCAMTVLFPIGCGPEVRILGVKAPELGATCVYNVNDDALLLEGEMELTDGTDGNGYEAVFKVQNPFPHDVAMSGATVRYEYPRSPTELVPPPGPLANELTGMSGPASGTVLGFSEGLILATILGSDTIGRLFRDPVVKKAAVGPDGFSVVAIVTLQGKAGPGPGSPTHSTEYRHRIRLTVGRIDNCSPIDDTCQVVSAGSVGQRNPVCFEKQDVPECTCVPNKPQCTGVCVPP
ncbi:MAG: hypothetical protein AB2A00_19890 [Myxococcota bacterium]